MTPGAPDQPAGLRAELLDLAQRAAAAGGGRASYVVVVMALAPDDVPRGVMRPGGDGDDLE